MTSLRSLREPAKTLLLVAILAAIVGCVTAAAPAPIEPCAYTAKRLTDSTAVIGYASLPCWDASLWRVVRKR